MEKIDIKVEGMTCGGCVKSIETALGQHAGIQSSRADLDAHTVTVEFDPGLIQQGAIESAIEAAGFDVAR